jgi:hypothetical protein
VSKHAIGGGATRVLELAFHSATTPSLNVFDIMRYKVTGEKLGAKQNDAFLSLLLVFAANRRF